MAEKVEPMVLDDVEKRPSAQRWLPGFEKPVSTWSAQTGSRRVRRIRSWKPLWMTSSPSIWATTLGIGRAGRVPTSATVLARRWCSLGRARVSVGDPTWSGRVVGGKQRTDRGMVREVVPGQGRERSTIAAASGRPSRVRPVTTPSMSPSGRFWLILTLTSTREITSSTPTMARS